MLPPVPSGIGHISVSWAVGTVPSHEVTNGFWIYSSGLEAFGEDELQGLLGQFLEDPLEDLLSLIPDDVSPSVCRLSTYGTTPLTVILPAPIASGAGGFAAPGNAALALSWRSSLGGQSQRSTTFLPLPHDDVDDSGTMLTTSAYGSAQGTANAFLNHMNALAYESILNVEMVTLHRRTASGPSSVASFSPIVYGHPSRFVATIDRRIRSRGRAPSR